MRQSTFDDNWHQEGHGHHAIHPPDDLRMSFLPGCLDDDRSPDIWRPPHVKIFVTDKMGTPHSAATAKAPVLALGGCQSMRYATCVAAHDKVGFRGLASVKALDERNFRVRAPFKTLLTTRKLGAGLVHLELLRQSLALAVDHHASDVVSRCRGDKLSAVG